MPKAAVHEYHGLVLGEHNVGPARQIAAMKPEAVPHVMERPADD
jgi:hypothetical protein